MWKILRSFLIMTFTTVFNSSDNTAYLGTWGYGFVRTDGNLFETFNTANSGMQGIPTDPDFLVITGICK